MKFFQKHLGWKLFISYLVIIVVGVVSLTVTAELHTPTALSRHMTQMSLMMGRDVEMMGDITESFSRAINEVLLVAALLSFVSAVIVSTFVTRRIVRPIQQMTAVSQRIANGRYDERVQVHGDDELADLGRAFNQMAHELTQTENQRRRLVGDVAHELRTPLSSIKSVMEGLQDGVLPAKPETFANVEQEVSRLQRLVNDLSELSRAEAGQIPLERQPVHPKALIDSAVSRLSMQFADKQVAIHVDVPPNLPAIDVDPARITQVLLNLLGNALQYTPTGGQVTLHCDLIENDTQELVNEGDAFIQIRVEDSGIGLTPEQLNRIFERFYRVEKSRSRAGGGSGIGLTISKHLVEAHNGRLTATSQGLNKGSTFIITLPVHIHPKK